MKVYIIFDQCPCEFSDQKIIEIHATPLGAYRKLQALKKEDEYRNQYVVIIPGEVK